MIYKKIQYESYNKYGEFCPRIWQSKTLFTVAPFSRKSIVVVTFMECLFNLVCCGKTILTHL